LPTAGGVHVGSPLGERTTITATQPGPDRIPAFTREVSTGHRIVEVAHAIRDSHDRLEPIGFFSLDSGSHEELADLGELSDLRERIDQHAIEELIIVDPDFPQDRAVELVDRCRTQGVRVWVAPTTMEVLTRRTELVPGEGVPLLEVKPPVFEGFDFVVKRSFDFVISVPGYPRRVEGRRAVAELYRGYGSNMVLRSADELAVHRDREASVIVLEYAVHGQAVQTGRTYDNHFVSVITIKDRKVTHWRDYLDPVAVFNAIGWPAQ